MKAVTTAENRPAFKHSDISFEMRYQGETYENQEVLDLLLPFFTSCFIPLFLCFQ